ncbi:MAG: tRNA epoxyqueuosine(34) reductase QueG [Anaerolineae bacterium]|nr:tRNA epoxyqueuosine(34) reductase QueG [Thermoflexales bacterium]MDW8053051.1 tRNA epoxyqueuosine(34) reductase QueG [Anaerolineae bacterium]MDW8291704.1 tRNA epoxyqueuosine(34) reductase QueG [Anaerolineae bacterium]
MLSAALIREKALELGFDLVGFAPAGPTPGADQFLAWLEAGYHGQMAYLANAPERRLDPRAVLPGARTVVVVGLSYETLAVPYEVLRDPSRGRIARYAWGADYHEVITPVLRAFGEWLSLESRAYVDTGPVLERNWAQRCGLGFIGKNTCLIHRKRGSYLFLGAVLIAEELPDAFDDQPQPALFSGCGRCVRCLDACPTRAFPAPGVLDARRCIAYLTIELKGSIPEPLRPLLGNWVFGCDVCQDVCPYVRRFSRPSDSPLARAFYPPSIDRAAPKLVDLLQLDRVTFNQRYKRTPLARAKWRGLLRNACVAAGNWGSPEALPYLQRLAACDEPLVREHAAWAIARIIAGESARSSATMQA